MTIASSTTYTLVGTTMKSPTTMLVNTRINASPTFSNPMCNDSTETDNEYRYCYEKCSHIYPFTTEA